MTIVEEFFDNRSQASVACARRIAVALERRLSESQQAAFIASGGSTPEACYRELAKTDLDWKRVQILPSDDRCVPAEHEASNEGMFRRLLGTDFAKDASFVKLFDENLRLENQCVAFDDRLESISHPFVIALLGIGEDGHFASIFADADGVEDALDLNNQTTCMLVRTAASQYSRISLTLSLLLDSSEILLLFFGGGKRKVYEQAKHSENHYPLSKLLSQKRTPVRVFWAP